jgi:hypothetical protein
VKSTYVIARQRLVKFSYSPYVGYLSHCCLRFTKRTGVLNTENLKYFSSVPRRHKRVWRALKEITVHELYIAEFCLIRSKNLTTLGHCNPCCNLFQFFKKIKIPFQIKRDSAVGIMTMWQTRRLRNRGSIPGRNERMFSFPTVPRLAKKSVTPASQ